MKRKILIFFVSLSTIIFLAGPLVYSANIDKHHSKEGHHPGHHKAYHGGVLNVIGKCETGHIEVRLKGGTIETWLVGGGHDTDRAVPVKARGISLKVTIPGQSAY